MSKNFKSFMLIILTLVMILGSSVTAFADVQLKPTEDETSVVVGPMSDTEHYYIIKNKSYTGLTRQINTYLTTIWGKIAEYTVEKSSTKQISLTVTPTSGSFLASLVGSTGEFNVSYSKTFAVGSVIPADPSRYSKLAIEAEYKNYTGDLYYVIDFGTTQSESYTGSGKVKEPTDLYFKIIYQ